MEVKESEVEILGQKLNYPSTIYGVAFSIALFILIGFSLYVTLVLAKADNLKIISNNVVMGTFGGNSDFKRENVRQFQFWTPSSNTTSLDDKGDSIKWLVDAKGKEEQMNVKFGNILSTNENVFGYRRYVVFGKGRSEAKEGMWWVVNTNNDLSAKDLAKIYQDFWSTKQSIYIEQYNHNGSYK